MKKLILTLVLFFSFSIVALADTLTITYDANDGTGRTKVVVLEKGDSYTMADSYFFKHPDDTPDDPMDDRVISTWTMNPDGTQGYFSAATVYSSTDKYPSTYEKLNSYTEITLYAKWVERQDIGYMITNFEVTGDGVTLKDNGDYDIPLDSSIDYYIKVAEKAPQNGLPYQIYELSYFELPESFFSYFPDYALESFSTPVEIPFTVYYSGVEYHPHNVKKYIIGNKLFIDIIRDETYDGGLVFNSTSITINFHFYGRVNNMEVNGRFLRGVELSYDGVFSDYEYPKGKLLIKYIDADTGEELLASETSTAVLGVAYSPMNVEIDDYDLVDSPQENEYYYDEVSQTIYYKFRKKSAQPVEEPKPNEDTQGQNENPAEEPKPEEPKNEETKTEEPTKEENKYNNGKEEESDPKSLNEIEEDEQGAQKNPNTGTHLPIVVLLISIILLVLLKSIRRKFYNYN